MARKQFDINVLQKFGHPAAKKLTAAYFGPSSAKKKEALPQGRGGSSIRMRKGLGRNR